MTRHPDTTFALDDPTLEAWAGEIRHRLITTLDPGSVDGIVVAVGGAVTIGVTAAAATAIPGGTTMTTATVAATTGMHAKAAAGCLAAALVAGGGAAVTGSLPAGMQDFAADAAVHIGVTLPRSEASLSVVDHIELGIGEIVAVDGAGRLRVATTDDGIVLTGLEADAGFSGTVLAETSESILVEFRSATETATVLVTNLNGRLAASVTGSMAAEGSAGTDTDASIDAETEVEIDLGAQLGG